MTPADDRGGDALVELEYALAEGDADEPSSRLRSRVMEAAMADRPSAVRVRFRGIRMPRPH